MLRLLPPDVTDLAERRIARGVLTVLGPGAFLLLILGALQPLFAPGGGIIGLFYVALASPLILAIILVRRGDIRLAGILSIALIWILVTGLAVVSGGIRAPSIVAYPVLVGAAAFFWNARAAMGMAVVSSLTGLLLVLGEIWNLLPEPIAEVTILRAWGGMTAATLIAGVVMKTTMDTIQASLDEAQESERKFRELIQGAPDGMLVLDGRHVIQEVNRQALSLFRAEREALLGRRGTELLPELLDLLSTEAAKPRRSVALTLDGENLPVNLSSNPVVSGGDQVLVVTVGDISDEIEAEEARKKVEARLREAQKMEVVGQLAGGIAHDFNNLLTIVLGNASLELEREDLAQETKDRWGEVETAAARAADLTHQLLAFSRQQVMDPQPVRLSSFLREKGPLLQRILGEKIRLVIEARTEGWVRVDPSQMDNVILSLVQNARDAMTEPGILRILCKEVEVAREDPEQPEVPPGQYVEICFKDTGTGMDPDSLKRAFEPFFTTKGFGGGMGLGLATVHGIVTQSGGFISASSTPGLGSVFCLYLPPIPRPGGMEETG